jgi:uncharacterized membrane protein
MAVRALEIHPRAIDKQACRQKMVQRFFFQWILGPENDFAIDERVEGTADIPEPCRCVFPGGNDTFMGT